MIQLILPISIFQIKFISLIQSYKFDSIFCNFKFKKMNYDQILKEKTQRFSVNIRRLKHIDQVKKIRKIYNKQKINDRNWREKFQNCTHNLQEILNYQIYNLDLIEEYLQQISNLLKYHFHNDFIYSTLSDEIIRSMQIGQDNQQILTYGYLILMNMTGSNIDIAIQNIPFMSIINWNKVSLIDYFICTLTNVIIGSRRQRVELILNKRIIEDILLMFRQKRQTIELIQQNLIQFCVFMIKSMYIHKMMNENGYILLERIKDLIFEGIVNKKDNKYYCFLKFIIQFNQQIPQQFIRNIQALPFTQLKLKLLISLSNQNYYFLTQPLIKQLVQNLFINQTYINSILIILSNNIVNQPSSHQLMLREICKPRKSIYNEIAIYNKTINIVRLFKQLGIQTNELTCFILNIIKAQNSIGILQQCISLFLQDQNFVHQLRQLGYQIQKQQTD